MNRNSEKPTNGFGLLANGSSRLWDVAVDESLDRDNEWLAEIEGPTSYLVFQLRDLNVVAEACRFLSARPNSNRQRSADDTLTIGKFGSATVSLVWDNEQLPRCFIVVGPKARYTARLTLESEDVRMLAEALHQVASDLPKP